MSTKNDRVLAYDVARRLSADEIDLVAGGLMATGTSVDSGGTPSCDDDNGNDTECPKK